VGDEGRRKKRDRKGGGKRTGKRGRDEGGTVRWGEEEMRREERKREEGRGEERKEGAGGRRRGEEGRGGDTSFV
jgi:hypothetical protein